MKLLRNEIDKEVCRVAEIAKARYQEYLTPLQTRKVQEGKKSINDFTSTFQKKVKSEFKKTYQKQIDIENVIKKVVTIVISLNYISNDKTDMEITLTFENGIMYREQFSDNCNPALLIAKGLNNKYLLNRLYAMEEKRLSLKRRVTRLCYMGSAVNTEGHNNVLPCFIGTSGINGIIATLEKLGYKLITHEKNENYEGICLKICK